MGHRSHHSFLSTYMHNPPYASRSDSRQKKDGLRPSTKSLLHYIYLSSVQIYISCLRTSFASFFQPRAEPDKRYPIKSGLVVARSRQIHIVLYGVAVIPTKSHPKERNPILNMALPFIVFQETCLHKTDKHEGVECTRSPDVYLLTRRQKPRLVPRSHASFFFSFFLLRATECLFAFIHPSFPFTR